MITIVGARRRRGLMAVLAVVGALAVVAGATACAPPPGQEGCRPGTARPPGLPAAAPAAEAALGGPWATTLCPLRDQRKPVMLNGVVARDGVLWLASMLGGELLAADAGTGEILGRFGPAQGLGTGPDDLAMTADGTVYWTGMQTGEVGALDPATGRSRKVANAGAWVNPIALAPDGSLLVGHAYLAKGLVRVDPVTGAVRVLDPNLAANGFAVGPDGALYAPRTDTFPAQLVRVDPATGRSTLVAAGLGLSALSVRFAPPARGEDPTTAFVLMGNPPAVRRIDVRTGARVGTDLSLPMAMADNLAFAADGTMFVTGSLSPTVVAVGIDGATRTITIGRA